MQKVYSDMDMQGNGIIDLGNFSTSDVYISQTFDEQNITSDCTFIRCSGSIVIASGVTVNAIDCPSLTATGSGTLLRNGYAVGDFFIGSNSPAARAGGEWTRLAAGQTIVSSGDDYTVGATGGAETVTLTIDQIPSHSHSVYPVIDGNPDFGYNRLQAARDGFVGDASANVNATGGGQAHTNMPPYYVTNLWRRTA